MHIATGDFIINLSGYTASGIFSLMGTFILYLLDVFQHMPPEMQILAGIFTFAGILIIVRFIVWLLQLSGFIKQPNPAINQDNKKSIEIVKQRKEPQYNINIEDIGMTQLSRQINDNFPDMVFMFDPHPLGSHGITKGAFHDVEFEEWKGRSITLRRFKIHLTSDSSIYNAKLPVNMTFRKDEPAPGGGNMPGEIVMNFDCDLKIRQLTHNKDFYFHIINRTPFHLFPVFDGYIKGDMHGTRNTEFKYILQCDSPNNIWIPCTRAN